jgi:hypothetical protein
MLPTMIKNAGYKKNCLIEYVHNFAFKLQDEEMNQNRGRPCALLLPRGRPAP